jgi:hypothetical protein
VLIYQKSLCRQKRAGYIPQIPVIGKFYRLK